MLFTLQDIECHFVIQYIQYLCPERIYIITFYIYFHKKAKINWLDFFATYSMHRYKNTGVVQGIKYPGKTQEWNNSIEVASKKKEVMRPMEDQKFDCN